MDSVPDMAFSNNDTDFRLISSFVLEGNTKAFEELVTRNQSKIRGILYGILNGNLSDIEEVEQEILIALLKALQGFEFRSSFSTWLYRFCRNKAIDYLRRSASEVRKKRALKDRMVLPVPQNDNPADQLIQNEKRDRIQRILSRLREKDRSILIMRDMDGLSLNQISNITGFPEGTVKSRLHRARKKAAVVLEVEYDS